MFLLVFVLSVHVSFGNDQKKHGQAIHKPKETWTGNTTTKRNMDRQYNYQQKPGQTMIHKTLHSKLRISLHDPHKPEVNVGAPEGKAVPVQLVTFGKRNIHGWGPHIHCSLSCIYYRDYIERNTIN
jgi:hypothetical protein